MNIDYSVPALWYEGLYSDKQSCCSAARPFSMIHEEHSRECWILVHGFRGYPGELVRPATDLYNAGFDVYVPRLPGHGTSKNDYIRSRAEDWVGLVKNAVDDLKKQYKKVNILGHSIGSAIVSVVCASDNEVGKTVYACPCFASRQLTFWSSILLSVLSVFTPAIKIGWKPDSRYRLHYENAPCDDTFLGHEYWQYLFTRHTKDCVRLYKKGIKEFGKNKRKCLVIYPLDDHEMSEPSVELLKKAAGDRITVVEIENGTHFVFYDKDEKAEDKAVNAIVSYAESESD